MNARAACEYCIVDLEGDLRLRRTVGANVRRIRKERGLTQAALARMSGMSRQLLRQVEDGTADARLSSVRRLADALRVPPVDLLDESGAWDD